VKIATWNVNGIRARQAQVQEFIEREQPDVLCLQEIKAAIDQLPVWLCDIEGYWCYWHGGKGYSGVALHVRKATWPERPAFHHPDFDYEHRAEIYRRVMNEIIDAQRATLRQLRDGGQITDEVRRNVEHELDLEQARLERSDLPAQPRSATSSA
jgi:exodeoxyribonuclease III